MFSIDQYNAAHSSAVLIDRSSLGTVALTGADRASFLHALLTNDIAHLAAGRGVYAAYLTPQGRMISDARVVETGSRMLLNVERDLAAPLAERFDKLVFSEDVQPEDITAALTIIGAVEVYGYAMQATGGAANEALKLLYVPLFIWLASSGKYFMAMLKVWSS